MVVENKVGRHVYSSSSRASSKKQSSCLFRMKMDFSLLVFVVGCATLFSVDATVEVENYVERFETVTDAQLRSIVEKNSYVVALIVAGGCKTKESVEAEEHLYQVKSEIEEQFNAPVVKLSSKKAAKDYGAHQLPTMVFFRDQNPVIYDGPFYEDSLIEWFLQNSEQNVRRLTEETFEHLTQASTGATTGDWFILFCNESSPACQRLQPSWESVAGRLKVRMNVAYVDSATSTGLTRRFRVEKDPELIFFCLGKMYRYTLTKYDIPSLSGFALGWFTNVRAEPVPQQETPFDNLINFIVKKIKSDLKDPYVISPLMMLTLPIAIVVVAVFAKGREIKDVD